MVAVLLCTKDTEHHGKLLSQFHNLCSSEVLGKRTENCDTAFYRATGIENSGLISNILDSLKNRLNVVFAMLSVEFPLSWNFLSVNPVISSDFFFFYSFSFIFYILETKQAHFFSRSLKVEENIVAFSRDYLIFFPFFLSDGRSMTASVQNWDMHLKENILHSNFCHPGFRRAFGEEAAFQFCSL